MSKFLCGVTVLAVLASPASAFSGGCRTANKVIANGASLEAAAALPNRLVLSSATDEEATGSIVGTDPGSKIAEDVRDCGESPKLEQ